MKNMLKVELSDAHNLLRHLLHRVARIIGTLYDWIPVLVLNEFFNKQYSWLRKLKELELVRINKKISWLSKKNFTTALRIPSITYYCTIPPRSGLKNLRYNLRSTSNSVFQNSDPPQFSVSPIPHIPSNSSYDININPDDYLSHLNVAHLDVLNNKWFINLSTINIPDQVQSLLQLGEKFCLPPQRNRQGLVFNFIKNIEHNITKFNSEATQGCKIFSASNMPRVVERVTEMCA